MSKQNVLEELKHKMNRANQSIETIQFAVIYKKPDYNTLTMLLDSSDGNVTLADISNLNIEYDDGFGGQELFGIVRFKDGTWFTRGEYDGSEWWEYHAVPTYEGYKEANGL